MLSEGAGSRALLPVEFWGLGRFFSEACGASVKRVEIVKFYNFGLLLGEPVGKLARLIREQRYPDAWAEISHLPRVVDSFLEETVDVDLPHTREAAEELRNQLQKTVELLNHGAVKVEIRELLLAAGLVRALSSNFRIEFENESRDLNVFSVSDVGTHSTSKLLRHAHKNLPHAVVLRLDSETKNDLDEAGRCLGFDRPTAAGFHTLRAVERVIITYVAKVTKKVTLKKRPRDWGQYIIVLTNHGGDPKVIGNLQHIKDHYRNPIIHPEAALGPDEAFSLFNTSISVIIQLDAAIEAIP